MVPIIIAQGNMKQLNMLKDKMANFIFPRIKWAIKVKMLKKYHCPEKLFMDWLHKLDTRKLSL